PLVEADPVGGDQTLARMPPHRHGGATVAAEEVPVGALVKLLGQVADFSFARIVAVEILSCEQHAHQQDGCVDAGELDIAEPKATLHVEEMIEEALVPSDTGAVGTLRCIPEE